MAVKTFDNTTPKQAVKDRDVFIYGRVSSESQEESLPAQIKAVKEALKGFGYKRSLRGKVFQEQASGTLLERPELAKAIEAALNHPRPAALVVRDIQRFSRDPYGLGVLYRQLWEADVPLIGLTEQLVLGTKSNPNPNADLLAPILIAIGGQEVNITKARSATGVAQARQKGISPGQPLNLYPKEPLNPFREQQRLLKAGIGQKTGGQRLGRSGAWWRKSRDRLRQLAEVKGDAGVEEWLSLTDKIRAMEQEHGQRFGGRVRNSMRAVGRVTSLYLTYPWEVDRPTDEFIDEVFANPKEFLAKQR